MHPKLRKTMYDDSHDTMQDAYPLPSSATVDPPLFTGQFFDKSPEVAAARAIYLRTILGGVTALTIVIIAVFPIYWGSVWKTPHHTRPG